MDKALVSIIIPVYNAEPYLKKCLESVLRQSYEALEVLAVDDGSTDHSAQILHRYARKDHRLKVITQENQGVSAARNAALDKAAGQYLTFVDADDYIARTYIESFVSRMKETNADMLISGVDFVTPEGKVLRRLLPDDYAKGKHEEWVMKISAVWAHFYKRQLWVDSGVRFAVGVRGEDMPIALYFSAVAERIDVLTKDGYAYVQHEGSAMHAFKGLTTWALPLQAIEDSIQLVRTKSKKDKDEQDPYFELFALRILATCFFDLSRGASSEKKKEVVSFIYHIGQQYFPAWGKNPLISLRRKTDFSFSQRFAVWLLVRLYDRHMLQMVARLL